ncbi:hypothetical protein EX895_004612 [Sporisorium graminicola]|uniref:non-specific serine/threonine protein kinase n=1 Tax=Sporisorium graminicola TaxID=280036 RepID=A0A4U7KQB0_9BASI|nr:hypothetical protein EX895_004612 [Sporisorium graminicola]TKY86463.1 hypothetical protein EX895_004612 [Sporisorium graminicola]
MSSSYRPSPLRLSDTSWVTTGIVDEPASSRAASVDADGPSSLDLVPAPRASDLQIVLRTRDHAAYYDASSNELSLQKRSFPRSSDASSTSEGSNDAPLAPYRNGSSASQSLLQRFRRFASLESSTNQTICPTCARPWPLGQGDPLDTQFEPNSADRESPSFIAPNYFRLLAQATTHVSNSASSSNASTTTLPRNRFESASGSSTPIPSVSGASTPPEPINHSSEAQGYYARFFVELKRLGRGARGQVFLCQHVLNGNKLGKYAIKKIPVGDHAQSLLQSLNEVHLMESLHHPHLIHYQHAWIERCRLSPFAPEVPTLFVLMMAANGGSLADWISARAGEGEDEDEEVEDSGKRGGNGGVASKGGTGQNKQTGKRDEDDDVGAVSAAERVKIERLKAALRQRRANRSATVTTTTAATTVPTPTSAPPTLPAPHIDVEVGVHLLRTDEIYSLLTDIVSGLSFLHSRGILHLDIKPGNVLLHWDDDALIPRAMLSDFGSSLLLHDNWTRTRSGHTGTMEYVSPETIVPNAVTGRLDELSSKADMWSVGMVLYLLVFFRLPYGQTRDVDELRREVEAYRGFKRQVGNKGRGDEVLLGLLEGMLNVDPARRPSCSEVLQVLSAAAKQKEEQGRSQRRKHRHDNGTTQNAGVSLALYRPPTLPPLPSSSTTHGDVRTANRPNHNTRLDTLTSARSRLTRMLPARTLAVSVALLKCLSPALLCQVQTLDAVYTAILLLALVDLSCGDEAREGTGVSRRGRPKGAGAWVSAGCWVAHLLLLGLCAWRANVQVP